MVNPAFFYEPINGVNLTNGVTSEALELAQHHFEVVI
jgi:hypothetical protein